MMKAYLTQRLADMQDMHDEWDGRYSRKPSAATIREVEVVGNKIISLHDGAFHIGVCADGNVEFEVRYGDSDRRLDVIVGSGRSGQVDWIRVHFDPSMLDMDGECAIEDLGEHLRWLRGE